MDTAALIKKLRHEYVDGVDFTALSAFDMERSTKIYGWFLFAVKIRDKALCRCCLEIIRLYVENGPECNLFKVRDMHRVVRYTEFFGVLDFLREGENVTMDVFSDSFNPFIMGLDDISGMLPPENAAPFIFEGALSFIFSLTCLYMPEYDDPNIMILFDYLNDWIVELVAYLEKHKEEIVRAVYDENSAFEELCFFLDGLMYAPGTEKAFDLFFAFMKNCVEEFSLKPQWRSWLDYPIGTAVAQNNEHAFDVLMTEAVRSGERVEFEGYPTESVHILSAIFSSGQLLPGTRKGREAFNFMIRCKNPTGKIIELTSYPAYFFSRGETLLMKAVANSAITPDKYSLFVKRENDVNARRKGFLPPLGYAILYGNKEAVVELVNLGADIYRKDSKGNNIFHYVCRKENATLENIMRAVPRCAELLLMKNREGKTPLDYLDSSETL